MTTLANLVSFCKRRGFVFPSSEIYGGINSCYDYGPLGVALKNNIKQAWWQEMTYRPDVVGLDSAILMAPDVWKASGHLGAFSDPLVECKSCRMRHRADHIQDKCPHCGHSELTEPRPFHLMFKTFMGPTEDSAATIYLRPETAQGIFVNFENVQRVTRLKLPFGIAQIGKAFRNEITPGHFIFRTREFEQMEMQYFVKPGTDEEHMEAWQQTRMNFYIQILGFTSDNLRLTPHGPQELAHYAKAAFDIECQFPMGWQEIEGIHNRTDFDLTEHQKLSGKNLQYVGADEKYMPYVIETSAGCDRLFLATLCQSLQEETVQGETRTLLKLPLSLAPIKTAILPLSKKPDLQEKVARLYKECASSFSCDTDVSGSIGRRYRRQDEIGTPFCITIDFDSLQDDCATIRHRDTMKQERLALSQIRSYIANHLNTSHT